MDSEQVRDAWLGFAIELDDAIGVGYSALDLLYSTPGSAEA